MLFVVIRGAFFYTTKSTKFSTKSSTKLDTILKGEFMTQIKVQIRTNSYYKWIIKRHIEKDSDWD